MIGIDSNIIIDILRNTSNLKHLEHYLSDDLCTSEIVVYEIFFGLYAARQFSQQRLEQFEEILDTFIHIFPIDAAASRAAAKIAGNLSRNGQMIEHRDALIAASLLINGCKRILTKNVKDFERISGLDVVG